MTSTTESTTSNNNGQSSPTPEGGLIFNLLELEETNPRSKIIQIRPPRGSRLPVPNYFYERHQAYDDLTFQKHQQATAQNLASHLAQPHLTGDLGINPSAAIVHPHLLYKIITQTGFTVATTYTGPIEGEVVSSINPKYRTPVLHCGGGVNIPRFPATHGYTGVDGFFAGCIMSPKNLFKLPGLLRDTPLPEELRGKQFNYLIALSNDAALHMDLVVKWGSTADWKSRRANHASGHGCETTVLLQVAIPDEYDALKVERAVQALLSPWLHIGNEYFKLSPIILHDLMKVQTFQQLLNLLVAYGSYTGQRILGTMHQFVIEGRLDHVVEGRLVEVVQQTQTA